MNILIGTVNTQFNTTFGNDQDPDNKIYFGGTKEQRALFRSHDACFYSSDETYSGLLLARMEFCQVPEIWPFIMWFGMTECYSNVIFWHVLGLFKWYWQKKTLFGIA